MNLKLILSAFAVSTLSLTVPALAEDKMGHGKMDHGAMEAPAGTDEAEATGVINSVDADKGTINVTHEPVASLGWPKMTMDLPVTRRVDLTSVEAGSNVKFKLKKGRDDTFRVIDIQKAE